MLGIYRALFEQNIQADFIHPDEIAGGLASKYDVIYLSYPLMLQQPVADALKAYVRGGGTLISEARPAWNNERGYANTRIPGAGLDEVFGAREKELRSSGGRDVYRARRISTGPLAPLAGRTFNGLAFAEHLEVTGPSTRVLARFPAAGGAPGDPAIVMSRYGDGPGDTDWDVSVGGLRAAAGDHARERRAAAASGGQRRRRARDPHRRRGRASSKRASSSRPARCCSSPSITRTRRSRSRSRSARTFRRRSGRTWRPAPR